MIITPSDLRWMSICERHIWLNASKNTSPDLSPSLIYRLENDNRDISAISVQGWDDVLEKTQMLMEKGAESIIDACLEYSWQIEGIGETVTLRCKVDRLNRYDLGSSIKDRLWYERTGRSFIYLPIKMIQSQYPDETDLLQLDCAIWLLHQLQAIESPSAEFWITRDIALQPQAVITHDYDPDRFEALLHKTASLMTLTQSEPPILIAPHCQTCNWYANCTAKTTSTKSVTLLSLRRETLLHLAQDGITALHQIIEMEESTLLTYRFVGKKTVHKLKAQAQAFMQNQPVWIGDTPEICQQEGWFFDIETLPDSGHVWSIGWSWQDDPTQILIVVPGSNGETLMLPDGRHIMLVPDKDAAWTSFCESVSANQASVFHWSGFDAGVMRAQAPQAVIQRLNHRLHDLLSSFKTTIQLPERSNSLKVVAPYAGFHWKGYMEWWAALRDYRQFLETDNPAYLVEACHYQAGDVEAMVAIWKWLNQKKEA